MKGSTKISPSTKQFTVPPVQFQTTQATEITLNQVSNMEPLTIITVDIKVTSCGKPITLGTRQKQDVMVSDSTGWAIVQLWQENIGLLVEGCSYSLNNFRIIEYEDVKYIAMCWDGSEIKIIANLKDTITPPIDPAIDQTDCITLHNPKIAAVYKLETFFKCLRCASRTEPSHLNEVRCCNKDCGILNDSAFCDPFNSAEILIIDGHKKIVLAAFGDMITELLGNNTVTPTEETLLRCPPISQITYQNKEIVKVVRQ